MRRIERFGIFGGSFNPPHIGHQRLVRFAADRLSLTCVYIVPAAAPPHRPPPAVSGADRLALCARTFGDDERCVVSDIEFKRSGVGYTIDTLCALQALHAKEAPWYLLVGEDMYASFHRWKSYDEILSRCTLAVTRRQGEAPQQNLHLTAQQNKKVLFLDTPPFTVSSTQIRAIAGRGESLAGYVTPEAAAYIHERKLYDTNR